MCKQGLIKSYLFLYLFAFSGFGRGCWRDLIAAGESLQSSDMLILKASSLMGGSSSQHQHPSSRDCKFFFFNGGRQPLVKKEVQCRQSRFGGFKAFQCRLRTRALSVVGMG
ncbi:hypothetical protein AVEN_272659-1 [Araneus ventricosus]|uniref:Uncharacterized protein n=1 Tax=Araneus ventricosus TaxID=182803 RepID=A0A4Y2NRG9_ARAVE|nr:hypothetical protein AVEN_272659-1 [Araneus ventricosus]